VTDPAHDPERAGRTAPAIFLERQSYRRRRLMDAARLLPLFGALLLAVPLLWPVTEPGGDPVTGAVPMSDAMVYIFSAWLVLIVTIALFGLSTRLWTKNDSPLAKGKR
jgi:hypothetical protein